MNYKEQGYTTKETAEILSCREYNVKRCYRASSIGLELTEEEKKDISEGNNCEYFTKKIRAATEVIIVELYNKNTPLINIAATLGISRPRVCQYLREISERKNPRIVYTDKRLDKQKKPNDSLEMINQKEEKIFKPQKVIFNSKSYFDITALFTG